MNTTDYYPFGLTFNSYQRTASTPQKYLFNGGSELVDELGMYMTRNRMYDQALGRFGTIDPLADSYWDISPYSYPINNPILVADPTGMEGTTYLQVLTDEEGNVSDEAKKVIEGAINKLLSDFIDKGIEASINISYGNEVQSEEEFKGRDDYHAGDTYTIIGSKDQLSNALSSDAAKSWEDLSGLDLSERDGSSGDEADGFSFVNLDNVMYGSGKVKNQSYNVFDSQDFKSASEKLFNVIRHETGHDKLNSSDMTESGNHSYKFMNIMNMRIRRGQGYTEEQIKQLKDLHNSGGSKGYPWPSLYQPQIIRN